MASEVIVADKLQHAEPKAGGAAGPAIQRCRRKMKGIICIMPIFKVGDPRPGGYLEFFEWAKVQARGGLRQKRCRSCGLWKFPQE